MNTIKSFFKNNLPLQVNYYYFKDVKKYIDNISNEYDLLYSNLIRTALYFQDIDKPKILDMADSIGLNYIKSFHKTQSIIWKLIYKYEGRRLLEFEKYCVKNCGWADVNKWFIMGDVTRKTYDMIISDLKKQFKLEEKELKRIYLTKIES